MLAGVHRWAAQDGEAALHPVEEDGLFKEDFGDSAAAAIARRKPVHERPKLEFPDPDRLPLDGTARAPSRRTASPADTPLLDLLEGLG